MGDYGHEPRFGVFPTPSADAFGHVMKVVEAADRGGLDLVGVQDHPYQRRFLDAWALMATVLARTERVRVFPDVAGLPLRPPAVLAKTAASLDVMSGGRFELGLGAGAFWEPIGAMGGPRRSRREAASALIEAVRVVRLMWSGERSVRFEGEHYRLAGVRPGPVPAHPIGVWLGVLGPRLLRETGRSADGWVPSSSYLPPEKLAEAHARIDDAAADAGRDPAEIRRIYNVFGTVTGGSSRGFLHGPVEQWTDELTGLAVEHGMDTFVFGAEGDDLRQFQLFTEEVAPTVRTAVAAHRAG
ncbi:LLM class flavin-dependent oxidoreductase [Nocardiopsis composta]|uniref:Alkanesulfonate monooxygenase SsuD/methylene tetrahydromethanopterin reductase-like flavin-dependent oxidoreductase (Luciferase family) n=1 Tax=Nocardiopsis composta TaxID=157465 RepID=A0A7W8QKS8_9ACTN|nr:LLM class flavin-dependent oxidoreductase [Nocardiopsis composta]MBB5431613.1 alkanesulfonate monooxygenase SsuD/methylene tetrahydromethanopterin reductase-like flavin-dependent oxidoreductase (luciferase family) [Nocardiopsis composta]